jgi:hypothetical protein
MKAQNPKLSALILMAVIFLAGCAPSNDVVSDRTIQKRKYQKGFFVNIDRPSDVKLVKLDEAMKSGPVAEGVQPKAESQMPEEPLSEAVVEAAVEQVVMTVEEMPILKREEVDNSKEEHSEGLRHHLGHLSLSSILRPAVFDTSLDILEPRADGSGGYLYTGVVLLIIGAILSLLARGAASSIIGLAAWIVSLVGLVFIILWLIDLL